MNILIRPIITEKMTSLGDKLNRYGIMVDKSANKLQIKKAVEDMYGVSVLSVNTLRYGGKIKSRYTKTGFQIGKTNAFKKAVISLKEGDKIDFFSNI